MTPMSEPSTASKPEPHRTRQNAPKEVRDRGGVAMSLWRTGANETDCIIVARHGRSLEAFSDSLNDLMDALDRLTVSGPKEGMTAYTAAWRRAYDLLAGEAEL